jgi:hypothetical protein
VDVDPVSWRDQACALAGRNLTRAEWARYVGAEPYRQTCSRYPAQTPTPATSPSPSPEPSLEPSPSEPSGSPALCVPRFDQEICFQPAGHFVIDGFRPAISIDLDDGWYVNGDVLEDVVGLVRDAGQFLEVARDVVPVTDAGEPAPFDGTAEGLIAALRSRPTILDVGPATTATVDGVPGIAVDITVRETPPDAGDIAAVLYRYASDGEYQIDPGQRIRLFALEMGDSVVVVTAEAPADAFDAFWDDAALPVVESISFQ